MAAGTLIFVAIRRAGVDPRCAVAAVALIPVAVAPVLAAPALRGAVMDLLETRQADAQLNPADAAVLPGVELGADVGFLAWARGQFAEGDTFGLEIGVAEDNGPRGESTMRQVLLQQWITFQLAPHLLMQPAAPGELADADWVVFYESDPTAYQRRQLGSVQVYAPGFAIARASDAS
ncbi:MAG TPA: hypothetical protein VFN85_01665 [Solirubrobacterales bacterium]|nr:hypothetical protein [Solirubrobacterales bacterium]